MMVMMTMMVIMTVLRLYMMFDIRVNFTRLPTQIDTAIIIPDCYGWWLCRLRRRGVC